MIISIFIFLYTSYFSIVYYLFYIRLQMTMAAGIQHFGQFYLIWVYSYSFFFLYMVYRAQDPEFLRLHVKKKKVFIKRRRPRDYTVHRKAFPWAYLD